MGKLSREICSILIAILIISNIGCSTHHVDTADEWCEQLTGVDLDEKYAPFWSIFPSVSFDGDAIRDDFTTNLNKVYLEKVENRTPEMAWREGTELHIYSLSTFFVVEVKEEIEEWREKIELAKEYKHTDLMDICVFRTLTSMFDSLHIHTIVFDTLGEKKSEDVTVILTDRKKRLKRTF